MNNTSLRFQTLLSETIQLLSLLFGEDMTYARLIHMPEIHFGEDKKITKIEGVDDEIIAKLLALFMPLSPEAVEQHVRPFLASYHAENSSLPVTQPTQATITTAQVISQNNGVPEKIAL